MDGGSGLFWIIFVVLPAITGVIVAVVKPPEFVAWINKASAWWDAHHASVKAKGGLLVGGLWGSLIWGFHKLHQWTEGIEDEANRAGARFALFFAVAGVSLIVIASLIYLALIIAVIVAGLLILGKMLAEGHGAPERSLDAPMASRRGRSRRRKDWLGNEFTEHLDESGRPVGRSEVKKDWLGETYVETRNSDGDVVETSRARTDWLGDDYTEHRDADGARSGQSRVREDWLGDEYVEHRDADNRERGRSRKRRDWLGDDYVEHDPSD